jgi:hypothetical protein
VLMEACQVGVKKDKDEKKINGGAAKKVIDPGQKRGRGSLSSNRSV